MDSDDLSWTRMGDDIVKRSPWRIDMTKLRILRFVALSVIFVGLAACAGSEITDSWSDPSAGPIKFKKVIVFFFSKETAVRRAAENELVRQIDNTEAVAAYNLIPETEFEDLGKVEGTVKSKGFDGAIIMRLLGVETQKSWVRGHYPREYYSFDRYYGYAWNRAYDPGYLRTDRLLRVETNVYSIADNKLIWTGISETFNPENTVKLVADVARAVAKDLESKGLL